MVKKQSFHLAKRFAITFVLMVVFTGAAYWLLGKPMPGVDDAYIFLTYGKNVANGNGFVYNAGGERVEGFSSLLWQIIVSLAFVFTRHPQFWLQVVSLAMVSGAIALLSWAVDAGTAVTYRSILLLTWVFASPAFVIWNGLTLMDTALWGSLLVLGTVATLTFQSTRFLTLLVPLIVLARPEGMLWGLVFIFLLLLLETAQNGVRAGWRAACWPTAAYLVTLTGLIGWRLWYFGYPLPNTYYAKVSPDVQYNLVQGSIYLRDFLLHNPYVALMGLGASMAIILLNFRWIIKALVDPPADKVKGKAWATALLAIVGLLVPVWAGGDHFNLYRFYQPVWPILLLPTFALIDLQEKQVSRYWRYGLVTGAILIFLFLLQANWLRGDRLREFTPEFRFAEAGQQVGNQLNTLFTQQRPSMGAIIVGGIGYAYGGPVIDVMGLNNVQMAHTPGLRYGYKNHAAFNEAVFYEQNPQLFLPELAPDDVTAVNGCHHLSGNVLTWPNSALNGMLSKREFWQKYGRGVISQNSRQILAYVDREYADKLVEQGFTVTLLDCPITEDDTVKSSVP